MLPACSRKAATAKGKREAEQHALYADADALVEAGAFGVVLD
jgi:ketopantoate hydroxymethyltransferase